MTWKITGAPGTGDDLLYSQAGTPSLDLRFASTKSLVDYVSGNNLIAFNRNSRGGTYVDSDGVLRTAVTNSELHSEAFDNASHYTRSGINAFGSGSVANAIAAPNGLLTADFITEDTTVFRHRLAPVGKAVVSGITYTYSIYAKSSNRNLFLNCNALFNARAAFNLQTGVMTVSDGSGVIEPVGDGWYRCSITGTATSTKIEAYYIQIQTGTVDENYTGDGTSGIYLWGAQLEESSTVGEYIPTTSAINSAPRFDHNPTTGESLGLLVEESRTNLLLRSEEFDQSPWTTLGLLAFGSGSTSNAITAPNGTTTADLITEDTGNNEHRIGTAAISWAGNTQYTFSVFYKNNGTQQFDIIFGTAGNWVNGSRIASINLSTNVISTSGNPVTATITAYPNGWYRATATVTSVASPSASSVFIRLLNSAGNSSYQGDGTSGLYLWGAQLEAGAFPTSYIKNVDTAGGVTRTADVANITGTAFSGWYNQSEGTMFADAVTRQVLNTPVLIDLNDTTTTNRISMGVTTGSLGQMFFNTAGVSQGATNTSNALTIGEASSLGLAYSFNNCAISMDGGGIASDTTVTLPTVTNLSIGFRPTSSQYFNGHIRRLTYFNRRLLNSTLQQITL